jgi:hypothetical protein
MIQKVISDNLEKKIRKFINICIENHNSMKVSLSGNHTKQYNFQKEQEILIELIQKVKGSQPTVQKIFNKVRILQI